MSLYNLELTPFELEFLLKYLTADRETRDLLVKSNRRTFVKLLLKIRLLHFDVNK